MKNFIISHKMSILSVLLLVAAAVLGADGSFAMAAVPTEVEPADPANPSDTENGGIEARQDVTEKPSEDLAGLKTQLPGKAATATDVRDAGLEAEDFDKKMVFHKKFKYTSDAMLMVKATPIKVNAPVVEHFRVGQPDIDAVYTGSTKSIGTPGEDGVLEFTLDASDDFRNGGVLTVCKTFILNGIAGYKKDAGGNWVKKGSLVVVVLSHSDETGKVKFRTLNAKPSTAITLSQNERFIAGATMGSESQIRVAPVTFLPELKKVKLQKKLASTIITDAFKEQIKKCSLTEKDVISYATDIFKQECARTLWMGAEARVDIKVPEIGNREAAYAQEGLISQIASLYTHGEEMNDNDLMAITSIMFTEFAQSDKAIAFLGKREMKRVMKLINGAQHFKDVTTVTVNEYGIKVRSIVDNFGTIDLYYDQCLDDLGYADCMVVLDPTSIVRYYMRDDKVQNRDMKKTGEAREAEEWNISRIDAFCIKGGNSVLVCPESFTATASRLGQYAQFATVDATGLSSADKSKKYFLSEDAEGFTAGTLIEWDPELDDWKQFDGRLFA